MAAPQVVRCWNSSRITSEECPGRCGRYCAVEAADAPGVGEEVALRERVARVDQHLGDAGDPGAAADRRDDRRPRRRRASPRRSGRRRSEPIAEAWVIASPTFISPRACRTASRAERPVPVAERSSLPGATTTAFLRHLADAPPGLRDLDDAHAGDRRVLRVDALELLARRGADPLAGEREVARLLGRDLEAERLSRRRSRTTCRRRRRRP